MENQPTSIGKQYKIPEGFVKCEICGEYNGKTKAKNLNWHDSMFLKDKERREGYISVSCLCKGIVCRACNKNKIHRPISNSYEEETNSIGHWPSFSGMRPCQECINKKIQ